MSAGWRVQILTRLDNVNSKILNAVVFAGSFSGSGSVVDILDSAS